MSQTAITLLQGLQKKLGKAKTPMAKKSIQKKIDALTKRMTPAEVGKAKIGDDPKYLLKPLKVKKPKKSIIDQLSSIKGKGTNPAKEYLGESSWQDFADELGDGGFEGGQPDFLEGFRDYNEAYGFNDGGSIKKKIRRAALRGGRRETRGT